MKGRVLVLALGPEGAERAALVVDGRLEDLLADPAGEALPAPGTIHGATVDRLVPKQGAAFLRLGGGRTGYLRQAGDVREGERLPVQVVSLPDGGKASPVTRRVLHKGRLVMLTPGAPGINVSRRIREPAERERLEAAVTAAMAAAGAPEGAGAVLRTAARDAPEEELRREVAGLVEEHRALADAAAPGPLTVAGAFATALREWTDPLPQAIVCSDEARGRLAADPPLVLRASERLQALCRTFPDGDPFDHHGVWEAVAALGSPRVALPSGGAMTVEPTTALVAVDVDSGGAFGGGAALTACLEAARELPRQLRLRGLGGQVVVDFAPVPKKDRRRVEDALKTAFQRDPVETALLGWTLLGHFELSRKRERRPLGPEL